MRVRPSPRVSAATRSSEGSEHVLAAVDGDVRTCQECRLIACEISDETCHLFRLSKTTHRNLRNDLAVQNVLRNRHYHLRPDVARRDRIDGDALARDFERERFGEAVHPG